MEGYSSYSAYSRLYSYLLCRSRLFFQQVAIFLWVGHSSINKGISLSQGRDLRKYARSTQRRLVAGVLIIIFLLGDGMIYLIYGARAGRMALICTGLGLIPVVLIGGLLWLFSWFARRVSRE
jgi:hypothetical protein